MELRRIQITGGSSFMVTLPKDWADSVGLKKNDTVSLTPQSDGSLSIRVGNSESSEKRSAITIEVDASTDTEFLYRKLIGAYIAGHDSIILTSKEDIPGFIAEVASSFTQTSIGLEIMDESERSIVIKDLMYPGEIKPSKSVERMKVLTRNMINDVITSAEKGTVGTLTSMNDRDREVDRINWLISRQMNMHMTDLTLSSKTEMTLCEITSCNLVSRCIERIGDHAVILSKHAIKALEEDSEIDSSIIAIGKEILQLFISSVDTWNKKDMVAANECIVKANNLIEDSIKTYRRTKKDIDSAIDVILASMRRIAEYSIDIAEIAINSSMDICSTKQSKV